MRIRNLSLQATLLLACACLPAAAQEGVTKNTITIGQSAALTGPGSALAVPFHAGAKIYFDRVNAAGGVSGRKIELVTLDDKGDPAAAKENTSKLMAQGVLALFGFYGSPQVTAAYPLIKDGNTLLFAPMAAADEFRGAAYPNVYSIRPGYSEEAVAVTRHAETLGARRLAILHGPDSESLAALEAADRTSSSLGANLVAKGVIPNPATVGKVLASKAESVLLIGSPQIASDAVRELRDKGFRGPVYGFSNTGESLLAEQLGAAGKGVIVARVVPKSDNLRIAIVRDLHADAAAAKAGKPNVYMLEGYIAARVLTEALQRVTKEPNRARLKKAIDGMNDVTVGDFRVHFAEDRVASKLVELSLIDSQGKVRE
jgi:branched-chain amino acid transport system substrate-binding protein